MYILKATTLVSLLLLLAGCGGGHSGTAKSLTPMSSTVASSVAPSSTAPSSMIASSSVSSASADSSASNSSTSSAAFTLASNSFAANATIPSKYTCDGININPELNWQNVPANTLSFAIIIDDPDAQSCCGTTWVHWNVYNIGSTITEIAEGASTHADLMPAGSTEATSDFGTAKYGGPCPPSGKHNYKFTVYALSQSSISFTGPLTRSEFEALHSADIIAAATLNGFFR